MWSVRREHERTSALARLLFALLMVVALACKPRPRLGHGPPTVDEHTQVLPAFDPGALAGPGASDLELDAALAGRPRPEPPPLPAPAVLDYGPLAEASAYPSIQIRFNRAMVPLGDQRRSDAKAAGFEISPPIEGQAYWAEPTRLVFEPEDSLPAATVYEIAFHAQLDSVDGPPLDVALDWSFATARPELDAWMEWDDLVRSEDDDEYHHDAPIYLMVEGGARAKTLREHLEVVAYVPGEDPRTLATRIRAVRPDPDEWRSPDFVITPVGHWPARARVVLTVDEDFVTKLGPRPIGVAWQHSFFTAPGVELERRRCVEGEYEDGCELGPIQLSFSAPISRAQAKWVSISPRPSKLEVRATDEVWGQNGPRRNAYWEVELWGDFVRDVDYEITVDPRLVDVYGQQLVGPPSQRVRFVEPAVELELEREYGQFIGASAATVGIETRHVDELRVRVAVLSDEERARLHDYDLEGEGWPAGLGDTREELIKLAHTGAWGWSSHALDLGKYTGGKPGALLLEVEVASVLARAKGRSIPSPQRGRVEVTELGLSAIGSLPRGTVRVARLPDDKPVAGAIIELLGGSKRDPKILGKTGVEGLLELPTALELSKRELLRVRRGDDSLLLPTRALTSAAALEASAPLRAGEELRAAVTTERPLYQPGERVRVIGWAAIATPYTFSNLRPLPAKAKVELTLVDAHDQRVATRTVRTKDHGKFWATFELPERGSLGDYELRGQLLGQELPVTRLQVKQFRVPEFEVTARVADSDVHGGESTTVSADASYYFGGRVPIRRARSYESCTSVNYRPPGLDQRWRTAPSTRYSGGQRVSLGPLLLLPDPKAPTGHIEYSVSPGYADDDETLLCTHSVALADASNQEVGAEATTLVHPPFYLGVDAPGSLEAGRDASVALTTVDFDGTALAGEQLELELVRRWDEAKYDTRDGQRIFVGWRERTQTLAPCKRKTDAGGLAACALTKLERGSYELVARGRRGKYEISARSRLWVHDPHYRRPRSTQPVSRLQLSVEPSKPKPGERVRARIDAPWSRGVGIVTLAKGGLQGVRSFTLDRGHAELEYTVDDAWVPGVELRVLAVEPGSAGRTPRLRRDDATVSVDAEARALAVALTVPPEAKTGARIPIEVEVRDAAGDPVAGHVSVWAVDEAVLSLAEFELPDFVRRFAVGLPAGLIVAQLYDALMLPYVTRPDAYRPLIYGQSGYGRGSGAGFGGRGKRVPKVRQSKAQALGGPDVATRKDFSSAPIFIGDAEVGPDGIARLEGELPDNLTTFRVTAVASAPLAASLGSGSASTRVEPRFGTGDARVRVTRPLVVRAAMPRILRPGDQAEIGVLVDNLRGADGDVELELALHGAEGVIELLGSATASAPLAAGEQIRVPFVIRALSVGSPELEVRATLRPTNNTGGDPDSDAVRLPLPVEPERTLSERVAVYGSLADDGAALLPFALPDDADPNFGGLSVSIGSTLLGGLEDAVTYLIRYPYGCVEQTSSSLMPLVALGSLAPSYPLGIEDPVEHIAAGVERLRSMQLASGGLSYWPEGDTASAFGSAYALWVLGRARRAGYEVPGAVLDDGHAYLRSNARAWAGTPAPDLRDDIEAALTLMTLAERGEASEAWLTPLYERRARLPVFSQAMLLIALDAQARADGRDDPRTAGLLAELRGLIDERNGSARVETDATWTWYWDSDTRSSALMLIAMLRVDPSHPLVAKLLRGLFDARRGGRWANTQANAYALVAIADYAAVYEAEEPDFVGRVWLGDTVLSTIAVEGRAFEFQDGFTPMAELSDARTPAARDDHLLLERAGQGRMYYRVGLEWVSSAVDKPAVARGIEITRRLRGEAGTVATDQALSSGDLVDVDVLIEVPAALDHVAIEVPLPAGLEAVDVELGKGSAAMTLSGQRGRWVSHQELRRDRALLFADHIEPGHYLTTVPCRATTPGEYLMPPAHAQMMYYPEVYGRTSARRLVVR